VTDLLGGRSHSRAATIHKWQDDFQMTSGGLHPWQHSRAKKQALHDIIPVALWLRRLTADCRAAMGGLNYSLPSCVVRLDSRQRIALEALRILRQEDCVTCPNCQERDRRVFQFAGFCGARQGRRWPACRARVGRQTSDAFIDAIQKSEACGGGLRSISNRLAHRANRCDVITIASGSCSASTYVVAWVILPWRRRRFHNGKVTL